MDNATKILDDRRAQHRESASVSGLVSCILKVSGGRFVCDVINYHYEGACVQIPRQLRNELNLSLGSKLALDFHLGEKCLKSDISAEIVWEDIESFGMVGLQFLNDERTMLRTAERAACHGVFRPTLVASDPVDPNRRIFYHVIDVSPTGMLVSTSMTNKHLFPGMTLRDARLSFPDQDAIDVDLFIENTRPSELETMFYLGLSVRDKTAKFQEAMRSYLAILAPVLGQGEGRSELAFKPKHIRSGLSYRVITVRDTVEYEKLLKLRFAAYKSHNKVKAGSDWRDQSSEQDSLGVIICSYLGGQMVAAMELLFGSECPEFRLFNYAPGLEIPELTVSEAVEINKLVVHPSLQGTDVVVGMFQKCHGILVARGGRDVVICATDKLAPLYKRLGFARLPYLVPHPSLPGQTLNVLLLKKEVYLEGKLLSPGTWSFIYQTTHEHMERLGLASYGPKHRIMSLTGRALVKALEFKKDLVTHFRRSQSKSQTVSKSDGNQAKQGRAFVDPKWTSQHMVASIIRPYLLCADDLIGKLQVNRILAEIGVERRYFELQTNWISVAFLDAFVEKFTEFGDPNELSRLAGRRSLSREMIGLNYYILRHFATPKVAFKSFVKVARRFNLSRSYELKAVSDNSATVSIGVSSPQLLPKSRASCLNWQENFNSYIRIMTGKDAIIRKTACCYDGDQACEWEIGWVPKSGSNWVLVGLLAYSLSAAYYTVISPLLNGKGISPLGPVVALFLPVTAMFFIQFRRLRLQAIQQLEEFERSQVESTERYRELQVAKGISEQRYQEAKLFEKTLEEILKTNEISKILQVALDAACKTFGFDRAFVMLIDDDQCRLKTAMVRFSESSSAHSDSDLLRDFSVDVSEQRGNSLLLSSVYHTQTPVLIDDTEAHLFQLNAESRKLILKLKTHGFIMVAIPRNTGSWGVIIADKTREGRKVDKYDLVLLQRIGQHLGLALSKQADINREVNLRRGFEKYVPRKIVEDAGANRAPRLGGLQKEIISLFFDIRGYTAMSANLPPQVTIEILNKIFSMVQQVVSQFDGLIDKFLGDGVLVTWGSLGSMPPSAAAAVSCALEILKRMEEINAEFSAAGFPVIKVGMGIDKGMAVCGNIGSHDRMEFTSIGSTVNLSSRLEGLCKPKDARIIISEAMIAEVAGLLDSKWKFEEGVAVRGLSQPMTIGIWQ